MNLNETIFFFDVMYIYVYIMMIESQDQEGRIIKINIKALNIMKGKIKPFGNSYHVLIKKEDAEKFDKRKPIGLLFFEWNGEGGAI